MARTNQPGDAVAAMLAARLALRAQWSAILGIVALFLSGTYTMSAFLRFRLGLLPRAAAMVDLIDSFSLAAGLTLGLLAILLGVDGSKRANTINRPLGLVGVVLGFLVLFALVFLGFGGSSLPHVYRPSPR